MMVTPIKEESTKKKKKAFMKKSNSAYGETSMRVPKVDYSSTERTLRILKGESYSPPSVSSLDVPDDEVSMGTTKKSLSSKKSSGSAREISRPDFLETDAPDDEIMMTSTKRNILAEMDEFEDAIVQARSSDSDLEKKGLKYTHKSQEKDSSKSKSHLSTVNEYMGSFGRESTREKSSQKMIHDTSIPSKEHSANSVLTTEVGDGNIEMESICLPSLRQEMEEAALKKVHGNTSMTSKTDKLNSNIGKLQEVVSRDLELSEKAQENVSISEVLRDAAFFSKIAASSLAAASIASVEAAGAAVEKMLMGKSKDKLGEKKVTEVSQALDSEVRHDDTAVSLEVENHETTVVTDDHAPESPNHAEAKNQLESLPVAAIPIELKVEKDLARKEREARVKAITKTHLESMKNESSNKLSPSHGPGLEAKSMTEKRKLNYCVNRVIPVHIPMVTKKESAKSSNDMSFIRNDDEESPDDEKKVIIVESEDQSTLEKDGESGSSMKESSTSNESANEDVATNPGLLPLSSAPSGIDNNNCIPVENEDISIRKKEEETSYENLSKNASVIEKDPDSPAATVAMKESTEKKESNVNDAQNTENVAANSMVQGHSTKAFDDGLMDSKSSDSISTTSAVHNKNESANPIPAEDLENLAVGGKQEGTDADAIDGGGKIVEVSSNTDVNITMEMTPTPMINGNLVPQDEDIGIENGSDEPTVVNTGSKLGSVSPSIIPYHIPEASISQISSSDLNTRETSPSDLKTDNLPECNDICGSNSTSYPKENKENAVSVDNVPPDVVEDSCGASQPILSPLSSEAKTTDAPSSTLLNTEDSKNENQIQASSSISVNIIQKQNSSLTDVSGREGLEIMSDIVSIASLGTEIQSNKAPFLVNSLDDENGICKGDVLISLLLSKDRDASTLHGFNQVGNAIWRNRIMRRNLLFHASTEASMGISGNPPRRRNVLPVDVDNMHVIGALNQIKELECDAIDHLRHDEFEDALELYDDILYAYREAFKSRLWNENEIDRKVEYRMQTYIGNIMHNIGLIHLLKKDFNKALSSFEKAAESRKSPDGSLNSEALETKIKMAICLFALGHRTRARNALEICLEASKRISKDTADLMRTSEILNNLGCIHFIAGEPESALELFDQSLSVQQSVLSLSLYGRSHGERCAANLNISIVNSNLAQIKIHAKDHEGAITLLESILSIQQMFLQDTHESVRCTMENLAESNQNVGNNDKGLRMYQRLLTSLIQVFGDDHTECEAIRYRIEALQMSIPDSKENTGKNNSVIEDKVKTQPRLLKFFSPTLRKAKRQSTKEVTP